MLHEPFSGVWPAAAAKSLSLARLRMAREAAFALDAAAFAWLMEEGGRSCPAWPECARRGGVGFFPKGEASLLEALCQGVRRAEEREETALLADGAAGMLRVLVASGLRFRDEAQAVQSLSAAFRARLLLAPPALNSMEDLVRAAMCGVSTSIQLGAPEVRRPPARCASFLAAYAQALVDEFRADGLSPEQALAESLAARAREAGVRGVPEATLPADPFWVALSDAVSAWAERDLLGPDASSKPLPGRPASRV
jgi:hypothetical protein